MADDCTYCEPHTGRLRKLGEVCPKCGRRVVEVVIAFGAKVPIVLKPQSDIDSQSQS